MGFGAILELCSGDPRVMRCAPTLGALRPLAALGSLPLAVCESTTTSTAIVSPAGSAAAPHEKYEELKSERPSPF
jgi:hypothetical protein